MGRAIRVLIRRDEKMAHAQWVLDLKKKKENKGEEWENSIYERVKNWIIAEEGIAIDDIPLTVLRRFADEGIEVYTFQGIWTWHIRDYEQEKRDSYGD